MKWDKRKDGESLHDYLKRHHALPGGPENEMRVRSFDYLVRAQ